jgi:hypothetical protein
MAKIKPQNDHFLVGNSQTLQIPGSMACQMFTELRQWKEVHDIAMLLVCAQHLNQPEIKFILHLFLNFL